MGIGVSTQLEQKFNVNTEHILQYKYVAPHNTMCLCKHFLFILKRRRKKKKKTKFVGRGIVLYSL